MNAEQMEIGGAIELNAATNRMLFNQIPIRQRTKHSRRCAEVKTAVFF